MIQEIKNSFTIRKSSEFFTKLFKNQIFQYSCVAQIASLSIFVIGIALDKSQTSSYSNVVCFTHSIIYLILFTCFVPFLYNKSGFKPLKNNWWKYIIIAILEFEGTFLFVLSYKYANYIIIQFLDSSAIAFVLLFSLCILKRKHYFFHYIGALTTISGVFLLLYKEIDGDFNKITINIHNLKGEIFIIVGCLFYTLSNVLSEKFIGESSCVEWMSLFSLFASPVALVQGIFFDIYDQSKFKITKHSILWLLLYVACTFVFYILLPIILTKIGSASVNLNLASADIFAIIYASQTKKELTTYIILSLSLLFVGNLIFSIQTVYKEEKRITVDKIQDISSFSNSNI